jgi:hypothetical protein
MGCEREPQFQAQTRQLLGRLGVAGSWQMADSFPTSAIAVGRESRLLGGGNTQPARPLNSKRRRTTMVASLIELKNDPPPRHIDAAPGQPCPRCGRRHRSWYRVAHCVWPRSIWIAGDPPWQGLCYALLSFCPPGLTVTLWPTLAEAQGSKHEIDVTHCGSRCRRDHVIYQFGGEVLA